MAEQVLMLRMPRLVWIGGLAVSAACLIIGAVLWHPAPLFGVAAGLLIASFPLLARLDAVKLDGPLISVRRAIRWVGPIDLRDIVGLGYLPQGFRRPAMWLLIQREAGPPLRWYRRAAITRELRGELAGRRDLRLVQVAAGGSLSEIPGLAEQLSRYVVPSDALIENRARQALDRYLRLASAKRVKAARKPGRWRATRAGSG